MAKKVYKRSGTTLQQNQESCCTPDPGCVAPETYNTEDISAECVFIDKVYDSVVLKEEINQVVNDVDLGNTITPGSTVDSVVVTCSTKPNGTSAGATVSIMTNSINGITPPSPTPTDPSGIERIPLDFIDTSECDDLGAGTPIFLDETLTVSGQVLVTFTITFIDPDGESSTVVRTAVIDIDAIERDKFANLCMPSSSAVLKPSLVEFCGAMCDFVLPRGTNSITVDSTGNISVDGVLVLCITTEKKVIVPVQMCVLTTGSCSQIEGSGMCSQYPSLFPEQINVEIQE